MYPFTGVKQIYTNTNNKYVLFRRANMRCNHTMNTEHTNENICAHANNHC